MLVEQQNRISQMGSAALGDLIHYLTAINSNLYHTPLDLLSGSTIGQHTRHIIEFYTCLIDQYREGSISIINYAGRRRDYLIESQPEYALQCVENICNRLNDLDESHPCLLDCTEHGEAGMMVNSTIGRELIYNIEHTIHHLAIIKIALKSVFPSIELPSHFGVAPSTIRHRQEACAQ